MFRGLRGRHGPSLGRGRRFGHRKGLTWVSRISMGAGRGTIRRRPAAAVSPCKPASAWPTTWVRALRSTASWRRPPRRRDYRQTGAGDLLGRLCGLFPGSGRPSVGGGVEPGVGERRLRPARLGSGLELQHPRSTLRARIAVGRTTVATRRCGARAHVATRDETLAQRLPRDRGLQRWTGGASRTPWPWITIALSPGTRSPSMHHYPDTVPT